MALPPVFAAGRRIFVTLFADGPVAFAILYLTRGRADCASHAASPLEACCGELYLSRKARQIALDLV